MTKVSFYVLAGNAASAGEGLLFACRLAEKAMKHGIEQGQHTYLHCANEAQVGELDDLLWTFRQGSFVAHERLADIADLANAAPVIIGSTEPPREVCGTLINLGEDVPLFFSRFERVAEVVTSASKDSSRLRYKFYKDRGYPLETHTMEAGSG
jgi:DNA polymerase-3 subunit chi